ncbi:MAG: nuclear transport factor 2 family protein [Chloroflexia bacterium]
MADAAPPLQPQEHLNDASHEAGLHRYIEMWNTGYISVLEGLVAPTYVGYFAAGRRNRDELSSLIVARGLDPPGVVFTIEDCVAVGDRTAARLSATRADATPAGDFGLHLARWTGGRIVEEWWSWSDGSSGELGGNTD